MRFIFDLGETQVTVDGDTVTLDGHEAGDYGDSQKVRLTRAELRTLAAEMARIERMEHVDETAEGEAR